MKRLLPALSALTLLSLPQLASAQTYSAGGNNPTVPGIYVEGMIGLNLQNETDLDFDDDIDDASIDPNTGLLGGFAVGYNLPQGALNVRVEGELNFRANEVDDVEEEQSGDVIELENADTSSFAGMVNAHLDYYIIPNLAVTAGAGIGYANVDLDLAVVDDDASGFAYQGRLGARYNISQNNVISLGYTYFATSELEAEDDGDDFKFDYENHGFHVGYAYHF